VLDTPEALKQRVGTGDVIEIELNGSLDAATTAQVQAILSSAANHDAASSADPFWLHAAHGTLTVRALNAVKTLPAILDVLEAAGLAPGEVRVRQNTLEDVFIQLTGRRLRE
jgi:ABC-2 type transport system ATP-binding protein